MAGDFGFLPTDRPDYIFISYNSDDMERVGKIVRRISHSNVPVWYDRGLEYGEKWESQISKRIMDAKCVLLFFTKGILSKTNSYVKKEYDMATKFFNKNVYVVMLDEIQNKDVPYDKVPWWIDIQDHQSIMAVGINDMDVIVTRILSAMGVQSHEEKTNSLLKQYNTLFGDGQNEAAEKYLLEYLGKKSISAKAETVCNIYRKQILGVAPASRKLANRVDKPLLNHVGRYVDSFFECCQIEIENCVFTIGNSFVFHRGNRGDAHVINIWKDDENVHTLGGLIDAYELSVYYDQVDKLLYICAFGTRESMVDGELQEDGVIHVTVVESPDSFPRCSNFRFDIP